MSRSYKLLLVDDDADDALIFRKHLPEGFSLDHVKNAQQMQEALNVRAPDVLFMDYKLGAEDGLSLVRALRERGHGVPIVVLTGLDIEALGENALLAGATDFISKSMLSGESIERTTRWALIRRHVERRRRRDQPFEDLRGMLRLHDDAVTSMNSDERDANLRRVLYASKHAAPMSSQQFLNLCALAAASNQMHGVTGALVQHEYGFVQALEGAQSALACLMDKISRDPRHQDLVVLADTDIAVRDFVLWNMGSFRVPNAAALDAKRWMLVTRKARDALAELGSGRQGFAQAVELIAGE